MKRNLLTFIAISAIAVGSSAWAEPEHGPHGPGGPGGEFHGHGGPLDHVAETLNLTPDQKAKVQPILDQAKPQMMAIHQEAMQKAKAVMESTMSQIRPLLTPEQQKKADDMKKAHEDMHNAMKEMHDVQSK